MTASHDTNAKSIDLITKLKRNRVVAVLIAFSAILSGVAAFTDSANKLWGFVSLFVIRFTEQDIIETKVPGEIAWTKERLAEIRRGNNEGSKRYLVALHISIRYTHDEYNSLVYLRSINNVVIRDSSGQVIGESGGSVLTKDKSKIEKTIILRLGKVPTNKDLFKLAVAKYYTDFKFGNMDWYRFTINSNNETLSEWYGGQARLDIVVPDPRWAILRQVELLKGDPPILEVLIDNRSNNPLAISNILIHAWSGRDSGVPCASGDPPQRVVFAWPNSIENQSQSNSWTEIASQKVEVQTKFNIEGKCSDYYFLANVPVTAISPKNSISRLMLSLSGLPRPKSAERSQRMRLETRNYDAPELEEIQNRMILKSSSITGWSRFGVQVNPENEIFPNDLEVE